MLSNHFHDVLRSRPDVAKRWTDEEVAWRWKLAWPQYESGVWHRTVTDKQVESLLQRNRQEEGYLDEVRKRLSSISWYCGRLKESISRLCNFESEGKGHCWESRFHNRRLRLDEVVGAVLYKDLQHAKAGIVDRVEDSDYCAIKRHFIAEAAAAFRAVHGRPPDEHNDSDLCELEQLEALYANSYLAPLSNADLPLLTMPDVSPPPEELLYPDRGSAPHALRGFVVNTRRRAALAGAVLAKPVKLPTSATSSEPSGGSDKAPRTIRARPARQKESCKIHRRLQRRRRRRASRHPLLGITKNEYFELVRRAAAEIVTSRQDCSGERTSPPHTRDELRHTTPPGDAASRSRHFHRRIQSWLREHVTSRLPDRLAQLLLPTPRGDPPGN